MTTLAVVLCTASLAISSVRADDTVRTCANMKAYREFSFHRFERGFEESLDYPIPVVVEGALREVALIKLAQPHLESERIYTKICELANGATTPAVRYKASLVRFVFDFPELFVEEGIREYWNDEDLFTAIAGRLRQSALTIVIQ